MYSKGKWAYIIPVHDKPSFLWLRQRGSKEQTQHHCYYLFPAAAVASSFVWRQKQSTLKTQMKKTLLTRGPLKSLASGNTSLHGKKKRVFCLYFYLDVSFSVAQSHVVNVKMFIEEFSNQCHIYELYFLLHLKQAFTEIYLLLLPQVP